jgi:uncharacterized protein YhjY with autotransporter beta-barrel domain
MALLQLFLVTPAYSQIDVVVDVSTDSNTPEAAVAGALDRLCPPLLNTGDTSNPLFTLCTELQTANETQTAEAYRALSARLVTSQTTMMMRGPGALPVDIVDKRLAALRKAAQNATNAAADFQFNGVPLYALANGETGGGASADVQSGGRLSGFLTGMYTRSAQDETSTLAGFTGRTYGLVGGMDYRFRDDLFAGAALRYAKSDVDLNLSEGSLDAEDMNLSVYGTYYPLTQWFVDWTLHYGQGTFDLTRNIDFTLGSSTFNENAQSSTDGSQYGASVGTGYEWVSQDGVVSQIYTNFRYNRADIDAYEEQTGGGLNLAIDEQSIDSLVGKIGGQVSKAFSYNWGVLSPQLNFNYLHEFNNEGEPIRASFVSDPFNTQFVFTTEDRDANYFTLAAGLVALFPGGMTAYVQNETYLQLENYDQTVWSLGARMEF